jgi:hypothetical protein
MMTSETRPVPQWLGAAACLAALTFCATPSPAQAEDQAAARVLFDAARALMKSGNYGAACPKLEAALRLYASVGIALNLADCYENIGRTASAWTKFAEASSIAERSHRAADAAEAKRRQAALEPNLTRLVVHAPRDIVGLVVTRDALNLPPAAWDAPIPVDPGPHDIHAEAPGRIAWTESVIAAGAGQTTTVEVPALKLAPVAIAPTAPTPPMAGSAPRPDTLTTTGSEAHPPSSAGSRTAGWSLIGVGTGVAVGGAVLMIIEVGRAARAVDDGNKSSYDSTETPYRIGLGGAIAGGAAAAVGIALLATSHDGALTAQWTLTPWVDARLGGVAISAHFVR